MSDESSQDTSSIRLGEHVGSGARPLQIGDEIPNFTCDSHMGSITLHSYINSGWGVIFTYPRNNDPVSCTELGMLSKLAEEFDERNCKLLAIGVDSKIGHRNFIKDVQELQDCELTFPIIADASGEVFSLLGLVRADAIDPAKGVVPQTSVLVVDLDLRVRMIVQYPCTIGHNYYETLRAIDALQQATFNRVGLPANWKEGEDVLVGGNVSSTDAGQMFPKGFVQLRPWFRVTPQPNYE
ncbi:unnamed protein product [Hapterophycus canaliculatus]